MNRERVIEGLKTAGRVTAAALSLNNVGFAPLENADHTGAFSLSSYDGPEHTCAMGSGDCRFETEVTARNVTGEPLYRTTWYTDAPSSRMLEFSNGTGREEVPRVILPGEQISTRVVVTPPDRVGNFMATIYVDGQVVNFDVNPPDGIYYGGSSLTLKINVEEAGI